MKNVFKRSFWKTATTADVETEIANGIDVNSMDQHFYTPLMEACSWNNDLDVIKILIHNGADVNAQTKDGWTALKSASMYNQNPAIIQTLIDNGAEVDVKGTWSKTALMLAARNSQNIDVVQTLLDNGADVHAIDEDGWTPLMWASWNNNPDIMQVIMRHEAKINREKRLKNKSFFGKFVPKTQWKFKLTPLLGSTTKSVI